MRPEEPRCALCGAELGGEFSPRVCGECREGAPFDGSFIPFKYEGSAGDAVARMKYFCRPAAFRYFARELAAEMGDFRPDFITFVPQNRKTRRERGYNQTKLIARELGFLTGVPVVATLSRRESGEKQVLLSYSKRIKNAARLYSPLKTSVGGTCLIVDDVITTGATIRACCGLLKKMGCERVYVAAVAKTTLRQPSAAR